MSLLARILGHKGDRVPFDVEITYANGTIGRMPIFGRDMHEVLKGVDFWMPLQVPATSVLITERKRDEQ